MKSALGSIVTHQMDSENRTWQRSPVAENGNYNAKDGVFVRMNQASCVCLSRQHRIPLLRFFLQVFSRTGPPRRVDCSAQRVISVKGLSQGNSNEMPNSSIESATF